MVRPNGEAKRRHEKVFVKQKASFTRSVGGRDSVNAFETRVNPWVTKGKSPMEIHHFQTVGVGNVIYFAELGEEWGPRTKLGKTFIYDERRGIKRSFCPILPISKRSKDAYLPKPLDFYCADEGSA